MTAPATIDTRFGSFSADAAVVVAIPDGLPGFEACRRFVLLTAPSLDPLTCLHGLDEPCPSFLAVDPRLAAPDYTAPLDAATRHRLGAEEGDQLLWLALVRVDDDCLHVNLRAPVAINPRRMIGAQVIPAESRYAIDHPLALD